MCSRAMRRWRASHSSFGNWPFATERNCLYRSVACLTWCSLSCAVAARNSERRRLWQHFSTNVSACKVAVGSLLAEAAKARWLAAMPRSSLVGKAVGLATARLRRASASANRWRWMRASAWSSRRVGSVRGCGDQGGVEGVGLVVVSVAAVEAGEEAGYGGVAGIGGVEFFDDGEGLGGFVLVCRRGWLAGR